MDVRPQATEILVHITAPSRAVDDERYRAFASAYLNFRPTSRISLDGPEDAIDTGAGEILTGPKNGQVKEAIRGPIKSQDFPSSFGLSFKSALDNLNSPDIRNIAVGIPEAEDEAQSSWHLPPSEVADSYPDNKIALPQYASPTRILQHFLSGVNSSSFSESPSYASSTGVIEDTMLLSQPDQIPPKDSQASEAQERAGSNAPTPTVIPQSPPSATKRDRSPAPEESFATENQLISSSAISNYLNSASSQAYAEPPVAASSSRGDSEPPPNKRLRNASSQETSKALARSSSDIGSRQLRQLSNQQRQQQQPTNNARPNPQLPPPPSLPLTSGTNRLEIISPSPPVGFDLHEGGTAAEAAALLMTPQLAKLGHDLDVASRFRPERQARALRPFERGYWLVDVSRWAEDARAAAWTFLGNYVGRGLAGWGTRCTRDAAFARLRLYCFGSVAPHAYFLLYLASKRRLVSTRAEWVGGDGEVVIVMGARQAARAR